MSEDIEGFSAWARTQGARRHEKLSQNAGSSPADESRLFQVLYDSTIMVVFAELRSVFEVAVREYNDGCGFPDLRIGYAEWDPLESTCRHASLSIL